MTHTPGPWRAGGGGFGGTSGQGISICSDSGGGGFAITKFIASMYGNGDTANREADARLIAAAPDLLAALIDVRNNVMDDCPDMWQRVDDAIDKATGKEQG